MKLSSRSNKTLNSKIRQPKEETIKKSGKAIRKKCTDEISKYKKELEKPGRRIIREIHDINLKRLYELEKEAFKDNPDMILDYDEFEEMFNKDTIITVIEENGEYKGFIIANPMKESGYELDEYDEEQIRNRIGEQGFKRLRKSIDR